MIGRVIVGQIREQLHERRDRWRRRRLHFWLEMMAACERRQLTDCEVYYWLARKAMACNAWRPKDNACRHANDWRNAWRRP